MANNKRPSGKAKSQPKKKGGKGKGKKASADSNKDAIVPKGNGGNDNNRDPKDATSGGENGDPKLEDPKLNPKLKVPPLDDGDKSGNVVRMCTSATGRRDPIVANLRVIAGCALYLTLTPLG